MNAIKCRILLLLVTFVTFSNLSAGFAQNQLDSRINNVPTCEELFITGKFSVKKSWWRVLNENPYGKKLDLSIKRPVVDLAGSIFEVKYGKAGTRLIGNFFHRGQFYIARIPNEGVQSVYFQIYYFPPVVMGKYVAAHTLLRFKMADDRPVELVAPMPNAIDIADLQHAIPETRMGFLPEAMTSPDRFIYNLAMSGEAQWIQNDKTKDYSLLRGALGAYTHIVRIVSLESRYEYFFKSGDPVGQIDFDIKDPRKRDQVLATALRVSEQDGIANLYDTLWDNCTTKAFDVIESVIGKDPRFGFIREKIQKRIPPLAVYKARALGGHDILPMQLDPTLIFEAQAALDNVIARNGGQLFPASGQMSEDNKARVLESIKTLGLIIREQK